MKITVSAVFALALGGCASIGPAPLGEATTLAPTADFTMRLPPFVTIEVLKNQRATVVGTIERGGKEYRAVALPAPAANALRFLLNDDGSFEGSAINAMGQRMGFSYAPIPPDVRLVSEGSAPEPAHPASSADHEAARVALDAHLARTLKDPSSAIQYRAGDVTECRNVANMPPNMRDNWCLCYSVNAKNSMGGFAGSTVGVVSFVEPGEPYLIADVPRGLILGCHGLRDRDSALIHAQVR